MAKNPFLEQFYTDLRARYPADGASMSYSQWVSLNTKLAGRPFSYEGREFQAAIVDDMALDLAVIKPSQVGMTEVQIRKFLAFLARNRGTGGIFTFPNESMFRKNSKTRIRPIVQQPAFSSSSLDDEKPQRSMDLYEIKGSFAHIMGMTEGEATSTPADILFHDELDLSDQAMIALFQSRLQASAFRITQKFSTPTHPGFGIDAAFIASDRRYYLCKCSACNHWQTPIFDMRFLHMPGYVGDGKLEDIDPDIFSKIRINDAYVMCERCSRALDLANPSMREWVAMMPAREAHGYKITPFSTGFLGIGYIIRQLLRMKQLDNLKAWHNTVLGETYSDGNSKLEPEQVKRVMKDPAVPAISTSTPVALGCDMGKTCHLTLGIPEGDRVHPFLFEQVPSTQIVERIGELLRTYNIVAGAVDRHPYTPTSNQIRDLSDRVILPVEYRGASTIHPVKDEFDQLDHVQVNRTSAIDAQVRSVIYGLTEFRGYGGLQQIVIEHLCDMVRIEADEKPATWEKLTGNDHFLHSLALMRVSLRINDALNFDRKAETRTLFGLLPVQSQPPTPLVAKRRPVRSLLNV